jgi:hypothetical protein
MKDEMGEMDEEADIATFGYFHSIFFEVTLIFKLHVLIFWIPH